VRESRNLKRPTWPPTHDHSWIARGVPFTGGSSQRHRRCEPELSFSAAHERCPMQSVEELKKLSRKSAIARDISQVATRFSTWEQDESARLSPKDHWARFCQDGTITVVKPIDRDPAGSGPAMQFRQGFLSPLLRDQRGGDGSRSRNAYILICREENLEL